MTPPPAAPDPEHHHLRERWREAAEEAERQTGHHEGTPEEVREALHRRLARALVGFAVIGLGIALLPLPGPGWLIIIFGLSLLPFAWAERTIRLIRRKVPGVPEDGTIPVSTWIVMGVIVVAATIGALLWGDDVAGFLADLWSSVFS